LDHDDQQQEEGEGKVNINNPHLKQNANRANQAVSGNNLNVPPSL
jgi:hypothetical protein